MNNVPRQQLMKLIAKYGNGLCEDPDRCEALLKEACGGYPREVALLIDALKEDVPIELLSPSNNLPRRTIQARLIKNLEDTLFLKKDVAKWAVESWAIALGLLETPTILQFQPPDEIQEPEPIRRRPTPVTPLRQPPSSKYHREQILPPDIPQPQPEPKASIQIPAENQISTEDLPLHFQNALNPNLHKHAITHRKIAWACVTGFVYGLLMVLHMFVHQYNNVPMEGYAYNTWYVMTFHDNNWTLLDYIGLPLLFFLPLIGWAAGHFSTDLYYLSALDIVLVFSLSFAIYIERSNLLSIGLFIYFLISQLLSPMLRSSAFLDRAGWFILFVGVGFLFVQGIQGTSATSESNNRPGG